MQHPPLSKPRWGCAGATLGHRLYVAGGCVGSQSNVLRSVECYDPVLNRWVMVKPMQWPRWGHALVACDGKLYAVGGSFTRPSRAAAEEYDPDTNAWTAIPAPLSGCRWGAACGTDGEGHLVLMGGLESRSNMLDSVEVYAASGGGRRGWTEAPPLSSPRCGHACALVGGFLYCVGGRDEEGYSLPTVERVNCRSADSPADWLWQPMPALAAARFSHAAVCFDTGGRGSGALMVVGGLSEDGYLQSTEVFRDDSMGAWEYLDDLHRPRSGCAAVAYDGVSKGQVWVLGGGDGEPSARTEIFERQKWRKCRGDGDASGAIGQGGQLQPGLGSSVSFRSKVDDGTGAIPRRDGTAMTEPDGDENHDGDTMKKKGRRRKSVGGGAGKGQINKKDGQAYAMSHKQEDYDQLGLNTRKEMQAHFARSGETKVLFSATVEKMNRKGELQSRTLCVTDLNLYNLDKKLKIKWSKPLLALSVALVTPFHNGVMFCFDASARAGAGAGAGGGGGGEEEAPRAQKGKLKKIKGVGKAKQYEYLLVGCESAEIAAAVQEVVALNAPSEVPFLSCRTAQELPQLVQRHPELAGAPLQLWFGQDGYGAAAADGGAATVVAGGTDGMPNGDWFEEVFQGSQPLGLGLIEQYASNGSGAVVVVLSSIDQQVGVQHPRLQQGFYLVSINRTAVAGVPMAQLQSWMQQRPVALGFSSGPPP